MSPRTSWRRLPGAEHAVQVHRARQAEELVGTEDVVLPVGEAKSTRTTCRRSPHHLVRH